MGEIIYKFNHQLSIHKKGKDKNTKQTKTEQPN